MNRRRPRPVGLGLSLATAALALLAWALFPSAPTAPVGADPAGTDAVWRAHFVRAADGDSFVVRRADSGRETELRLYGVDAPENGQPYGQAARRSLLDLVEGRVLDVRPMEDDPYGRVTAVVFAAGDPVSVNERQLERGMAWHYDYYCRAAFCAAWKARERQARAERAGLWRDKNPQSPRSWRKEH